MSKCFYETWIIIELEYLWWWWWLWWWWDVSNLPKSPACYGLGVWNVKQKESGIKASPVLLWSLYDCEYAIFEYFQ